MKKLMTIVMPVKLVAGGIFFGLIALYMIAATINARVTGAEFDYSVPFYIIIQGAALAMIVAFLVEIFFGETLINNWRFFKRAKMFSLALIALMIFCILLPFVLRVGNMYYFLAMGVITSVMGIIVVAITQVYYRKTGQRYTELLQAYKAKQNM